MPLPIQKPLKILGGLLLFIGALIVALYGALKTSLPDYDQTLTLSNIDNDIEIVRDENAIPHIFAETLGDAYFGLGFAHAQDRLWQVELTRAASNGQLSEIFGEATLSTDKLTRTINSARVAKLSLERMDPETKKLFQHYIDGINSFIRNRSGLLPPEFMLFSTEPKLWKLEDTAAIFALVGLGADNWQKELLRASMQENLSEEQIATLYPAYPAGGPITHNSAVQGAASAAPNTQPVETQQSVWKETYLKQLAHLSTHPLFEAYPASNTWVLDGNLTKSGKPLLASDPHGPIKAPADYYLAHLSGPDFNITGVGYPGMPVFAIGHNNHIAWGLTDIIADMTDLYAEKLSSNNPKHYVSPEGEKPFNYRTETIKVKGKEDVLLEVRSTHNGPVISDVVVAANAVSQQKGNDIVLSIANATLAEGNISAQAFLRINQAENWQQFKDAMRDYEMAQNLSYADTRGNIGLISSARVPIRKSGDGFMITPGWTPGAGIQGYASADQMPFSFNPEAGFLVNANNKVTAADSAPFFSREDVMPFRSERIIQKIMRSKSHTAESMSEIQGDVTSLAARKLLPQLLKAFPQTEQAQQALHRLSKWDGRMDKASIEPTLYMAWERAVNRLIYQDELGSNFDQYFASQPQLVSEIILHKKAWCNNIHTQEHETCQDIINQALSDSLAYLSQTYGPDMEQWVWGTVHMASFPHDIFTNIPLINALSDIKLANSGGPHTVNQAKSNYSSTNPFTQNYGPRYRQVIDLSDFNNNRFMIAPGVSGNFLSPYYGHLANRWRDQQYIQLKTNKAALLQTAVGITHLNRTKK